jgi:DNA-binding transcriptional MerR regulator
MRATELLSTIPGITMDHLHNWERQGYVSPNRISVGKKQIRDYSTNEAHLLKAMWAYYQKGFSPKNAYRNATEARAKMSCAALPPLNDYREDREAQARAIDSIEGIAIFELITPLRDYFRLNMNGKNSRLVTQSSMQ